MLIHPWDAATGPDEWQDWLATTDRFGMLAVNNLDPARAPLMLPLPSGSLSGSALSGPTGLRPHGTSPSMPPGQPRRTGSGKAGSPPTSPGC